MKAFPVVDEKMRVNEPCTCVRVKNNSANMKHVQVSITRISIEQIATPYYCEMNTHMSYNSDNKHFQIEIACMGTAQTLNRKL